MTELCDIAFRYRTDKCPKIRHSYTEAYHELFKDRRDKIKKVFEMGVGFPETMSHVERKIGEPHIVGASLFMWRDYFPNAKIYGADWDPRGMIQADRIKTYLCDERYPQDVKAVINDVGTDIDIFIDDGEHKCEVQILLAKTVLPMLRKDVIYIIEDSHSIGRIIRQLGYLGYKGEPLKLSKVGYRENLILVKNK